MGGDIEPGKRDVAHTSGLSGIHHQANRDAAFVGDVYNSGAGVLDGSVGIAIARKETEIATENLTLRLLQHRPNEWTLALWRLDPSHRSVGEGGEISKAANEILLEHALKALHLRSRTDPA